MHVSRVVVHLLVEHFRSVSRGRGLEDLVSLADELDLVLARHGEGWSKPSVDEAVLVSEPLWEGSTPLDWAASLRQDVLGELGLDCSIGIAQTRIAARICARMARPRGILLWIAGHEQSLLGGLPLEELDELRAEQLARLRASGIRTLDELAGLAPGEARELMGLEGPKLLGLLRGEDRQFEPSKGGRLGRGVRLLARRLSRKLESQRRRARGLELQIVWAEGLVGERYLLLPRPTSSSDDLKDAALRLLAMAPRRPEPVAGMALTATGLTAGGGQLDLFGTGPAREVAVVLGRVAAGSGSVEAARTLSICARGGGG